MTFSLRPRGDLTSNSDVCEAAPREILVLGPQKDSTNFWKCLSKFPFNLIGKPTMAFLTDLL